MFGLGAILVGVLVLALPIGTVIAVYRSILALEEAHRHPCPMPYPGLETAASSLDAYESEWRELGYTPVTTFAILGQVPAVIRLYAHKTEPRFGGQYVTNGVVSADVLSRFEDGWDLTTGNSRNAGGFPRRVKDLMQLFPGASVSDLDRSHRDAEKFLASLGLRERRVQDLPSTFMESTLGQMEFWRSHFLWPARAIAWATIKPGVHRIRVPIREQYEAGWLAL